MDEPQAFMHAIDCQALTCGGDCTCQLIPCTPPSASDRERAMEEALQGCVRYIKSKCPRNWTENEFVKRANAALAPAAGETPYFAGADERTLADRLPTPRAVQMTEGIFEFAERSHAAEPIVRMVDPAVGFAQAMDPDAVIAALRREIEQLKRDRHSCDEVDKMYDALTEQEEKMRHENADLRRKVEAAEATVHELWDELNKTQEDRDRFRTLAERLAGGVDHLQKCACMLEGPLWDCPGGNDLITALSDYRAAVKESGTP